MTEEQQRDNALELLAETRAYLIKAAKAIAIDLVEKNGSVTSPEVLECMRLYGYDNDLAKIDKRFMGVVFRNPKIFKRLGFVNSGSHAQPISKWALIGD